MFGYLLIFFGALSTIAGDFFAKRWSQTDDHTWMLPLLLYTITGAAFMYSLKFGELVVLNATWSVAVFVMTSFMGLFIFHERLSTVQTVALVLGFASITLFVLDEVWGEGGRT